MLPASKKQAKAAKIKIIFSISVTLPSRIKQRRRKNTYIYVDPTCVDVVQRSNEMDSWRAKITCLAVVLVNQ